MDRNLFGDKEEVRTTDASYKDAVAPMLSQYEEFITALQQQIQVYQVEHESLRKELTEVITENRHLSDRLKNALENNLSEEAVVCPSEKKESDIIANLQHQLSLVAQEKESAVELWHLALREVDKSYEENTHVDISNRKIEDLKRDFTEATTLLQTKLNSTKSMLVKEKAERVNVEKKHQRIVEENEVLVATLKCRQEELEAALEGQCSIGKKMQDVERKVVELERQVATFKETEHELESALSQCHSHIEQLVKRNLDAQEKVSESVQLVECALAEKEAAIIAEAKIREENAHLQQLMASVVEEAGVRVKKEMDSLKKQYNAKLTTVLLDMKKLQVECHEKEKKLRKEIEERNILEGQLDQIQKQVPGAEIRLNMVHEELSDVRRSNLQLIMEKESLHSQIERLEESHTAELQALNQEYQAMQQRVLELEAVTSEKDVQIQKLLHDIKLLEQDRDNKNLISRIGLQEWQQKQAHQLEHEDLVTRLQKLQKQSDATASELEHHLMKQHSMKTKYQKAMKLLTEKFEKRIFELRNESNTLKKENKYLEAKLNDIEKTLAAQKQDNK